MINITRKTQAFSTAEQQSSLKPEQDKAVNARQWQEAFGEKDLGEVLNKAADPNWIDPAKKQRSPNDEMGKDAFMRMLLEQMKNQDPTNPLKSHEMGAQLAQFTQLEKLDSIDAGIAKMTEAAQPKHQFDALNLIGKVVSGDSGKIFRTSTKEDHEVSYQLAADAQKVKVKIKDANQNVIRELDFSNVEKGRQSFEWKGLGDDGREARPGNYTVEIEARGANGNKLAAQTSFEGKVTGVNYTNQGPVLMVGKQTLRLSDVRKIIDPNVQSQEEQVTGMRADKAEVKADEGPETAIGLPKDIARIEDTEISGGNLEDVGMSREMINHLNKEVGE